MKIYATGTYNNGTYTMQAPAFPYESTVYIGYTLEGMKRRYRAINGLKRKHIEWIILGI